MEKTHTVQQNNSEIMNQQRALKREATDNPKDNLSTADLTHPIVSIKERLGTISEKGQHDP